MLTHIDVNTDDILHDYLKKNGIKDPRNFIMFVPKLGMIPFLNAFSDLGELKKIKKVYNLFVKYQNALEKAEELYEDFYTETYD